MSVIDNAGVFSVKDYRLRYDMTRFINQHHQELELKSGMIARMFWYYKKWLLCVKGRYCKTVPPFQRKCLYFMIERCYWENCTSDILIELIVLIYELDRHLMKLLYHGYCDKNVDYESTWTADNLKHRQLTPVEYFVHHIYRTKMLFSGRKMADAFILGQLKVTPSFFMFHLKSPNLLLLLLRYGAFLDDMEEERSINPFLQTCRSDNRNSVLNPLKNNDDSWTPEVLEVPNHTINSGDFRKVMPGRTRHHQTRQFVFPRANGRNLFVQTMTWALEDVRSLNLASVVQNDFSPQQWHFINNTIACCRVLLRAFPWPIDLHLWYVEDYFCFTGLKIVEIIEDLIPQISALQHRCFMPPKLKHSCRCLIRKRLHANWQLPFGIKDLPLCNTLQDYVDLMYD